MTGINGFNGNDWTRKNTGVNNNNGGVGKHENAAAPEKETINFIGNSGKEYNRDLLGNKDYDYRSLLGFTPSSNNEFTALSAKYPNLQNYLNVSPEDRARISGSATSTFALLNEIGDFV